MGIDEEPESVHLSSRQFWLITSGLLLLALALRWIQLDWMQFLLDQAAICQRAAMIRDGTIPVTGIINSMGFRNAPGYVWTLLPVFFFTTNALAAAAWHGLLSATAVVPLALIGRRYRRDALMWMPPIIAAVMPPHVFAGRNLWAQFMVIPFAAWALWALFLALDKSLPLRRRQVYAGVSLGLIAWAISIHYGAAPAFLVAGGMLIPLLRKTGWRSAVIIMLPAVLVFLTMLPSIDDYFVKQRNPLPVPEYATALQQPDAPLIVLLSLAAEVSVFSRSINVAVGLTDTMSSATVIALDLLDLIIAALIITGGIGCFIFMIPRGRQETEDASPQRQHCQLLLLWLIVPILITALVLKRLNPGYLSASLPAAWLLVLFLPTLSRSRISMRAASALLVIILAAGTAASLTLISAIVKSPEIIRGYGLTYAQQKQVAQYAINRGIAPDRIQHMSGPVFTQPLRYIARDINTRENGDSAAASDSFILVIEVDDLTPILERLEATLEKDPVRIGPTFVVEFPTRGSAEIFTREYLAVVNAGY